MRDVAPRASHFVAERGRVRPIGSHGVEEQLGQGTRGGAHGRNLTTKVTGEPGTVSPTARRAIAATTTLSGIGAPRSRTWTNAILDSRSRHDRYGSDRRVGNCVRPGAAPGCADPRQRRRRGDCAARRGRHGAGLARHFRREVPTMSAPPRTLTELFFDAVRTYGAHPAAFRHKVAGAWRDVSHQEVAARVQGLSLGLRELGLAAGEKVAILAETRLEWALTDYACLCARTTDVPIYPTLPANQVEYILRDAGAAAVVCSTAAQVEKIRAVKSGLPSLRHVIAFDGPGGDGVLALADLEARGRAAAAKYPRFKEEALGVRPADLATLLYTSGTTGQPKGVMLTHDNICSNVRACVETLRVSEHDSCLALLPLSHILERMVEYYFLHVGVTINYAESIDAFAQNLQEVRPTIVAAVPRVYEKVYARVLENAHTGGAVKRRIFQWAKRVGERWAAHRLAGIGVPPGLKLTHAIADRLVFSKLRARTGGRIKLFVSGSAPLSAEIGRFFYSAGLPVIEGYGLTETSPVLTLNPLTRPKFGTVGKAIPGVQLKIAGDGEILAKGANIMQGYYNKPAETREAIEIG